MQFLGLNKRQDILTEIILFSTFQVIVNHNKEEFCRENSNANNIAHAHTPPDSIPVAGSTPPLTSPDVTTDQINLLEAKLQAIAGSDALHISPPTPVIILKSPGQKN